MTPKRLNIDLIEDLFVREELIRLYEENEQLKESVYSWSKSYNRVYEENKQLKYHLNKTEKELQEYKDFMSLG